MIVRFAEWINTRHWFIRYLLCAEGCLRVTFVALPSAMAF
jgi:hypothetical protein